MDSGRKLKVELSLILPNTMNPKTSFLPSIVFIGLVVLLCLCLSACSNNHGTSQLETVTSATCEIPPPEPATPSPDIVASIYIDATKSMQGFVKIGSTTRYARLLDGIVGALQEGWVQDETSFFPFGEIVGNEIQDYREAKRSNFYRVREGFNYSQIDKAIEHDESQPAENRLTIIVTDLYQKNGAIDNVYRVLKERYLASQERQFSVGIIAHRSQFVGEVYDVEERPPFFYDTRKEPNNTPDKYHPFYLIVLGTQPNIEKFFDSLKNNQKAKQSQITSANWVIFSPKFVRDLSVLKRDNSQVIFPEGAKGKPLTLVSGINSSAGTIRSALGYQQSVVLLKISPRTSSESSIKNTLNYTPLPYVFIPPMVSQPEVEVFDDTSKKFVPSNDPRLKQVLKLEYLTPDSDKQQLTFNTKLVPSAMNVGIYRFNVSLTVQSPDDSEIPSWWKNWSVTEEIVVKKQGWKTYNLLPFLKRIQSGMLQLSERTVGKFCYLIQKED